MQHFLTLTALAGLGLLSACSADGAGSGNAPSGAAGGAGAGGAPYATGGVTGTPGTGGVAATGGFTASGGSTDDPGIIGVDPIKPADSCASAAYQSDLLPSNLLFVVDRSGSMNCNLPPITDSASCEANPVAVDGSQPSKWAVLNGSMGPALDSLATAPNTSVGLTFFSVDDACGVQSAPNVGIAPLATPQLDALKNALAAAQPRGGTPIVGATILAYKHIHQQAQAPGNRFVVLVSDGADSCLNRYDVGGDVVAQLTDVEIPKAVSVNIRTFVIGVPGSEAARGLLSKIAYLGGTPRAPDCDYQSADPAPGTECHLDMTRTTDFAGDLSEALGNITGRAALTCEFVVPKGEDGAEVDPTTVNVDYFEGSDQTDPTKKVQLFRDDTTACDAGADGWQYLPGNEKIQVCGATCDRILKDPKAQVVVSLGCEQRIR